MGRRESRRGPETGNFIWDCGEASELGSLLGGIPLRPFSQSLPGALGLPVVRGVRTALGQGEAAALRLLFLEFRVASGLGVGCLVHGRSLESTCLSTPWK